MSPHITATVEALLSGVVLWGFGYYAQKQGWVFTRRTEDSKLIADRLKTVELENDHLRDLVQQLRERIVVMLMERIGTHEVESDLHRLLTYSFEDVLRVEREELKQKELQSKHGKR